MASKNNKQPTQKVEPVETSPVKPDASPPEPAPTKADAKPALKLELKSKPKLNVMIASCGMLRDHEVFRQVNEGIVKQFGELLLEGVLLQPDTISAVPDTPATRKAIEDGILILMPG